ncbi:hypothetical protein N2152v2_006377 [Parachlorella kessleri]
MTDANGSIGQLPWEGDPLYSPFRRTDYYGILGLRPLPLHEKLRLAVLACVLVPAKLLGALCCLLAYYCICRFSVLVPRSLRSDFIAATGKVACRSCLFCLGFYKVEWIQVEPGAAPHSRRARRNGRSPAAIVSNHCGWSDILVHMSRSFPAFVARDATKNMPLIGLISQLMGCIYVNREHKDPSSNGVAALVKERIKAAAEGKLPDSRPLLLFPEGTTTNGEYLLPFKTGAFLAGAPVQPVILCYGKGRISLSWEMIPAPRHLFLVLCNPLHSVTCYELPVYVPSPEEQADPKLYANNVRKYMLEFAGLKDTRATFNDKMRLMAQIRSYYGLPVKRLPAPTAEPIVKKEE